MFNTLDFSLLNKVIKAPIFISIDDDDLKALKQIPQTHDRLQVALRFAWYIGGDEKTLPSKDENERRNLREGYLRASLTEFASIEETLKRDVINLPQSPQPLLIRNLLHPLPHLLKEMRNLEVHLTSSELELSESDGFFQFFGEEHKKKFQIQRVKDLTVSKFLQSNNAKFYDRKDISLLVDWFNETQNTFGVTEVIRLGVEVLADTLIRRYTLR